jgi:hypothetical protein
MTRTLVFLGLAASLLVPTAAGALLLIGATTSVPPPAPGTFHPSELEKDDLIAIHNELQELDRRASPGSPGQIAEARRIAREARTWSTHFDAEFEWEEFALATSALAAVLADGLEHPETFSAEVYDRAVARIDAARNALPDDRRAAE